AGDPSASYTNDYDNLGRLTSTTRAAAAGGLPEVQIVNTYFGDTSYRDSMTVKLGGVTDHVDSFTPDDLYRTVAIAQSGPTSGAHPVVYKNVTFDYVNGSSQFQTITRTTGAPGTTARLVATSAYEYDTDGRLKSLQHSQ